MIFVLQVRRLFLDETVHILQAMGFSSSAAYSRAEQLLELEKRIAAVSNRPYVLFPYMSSLSTVCRVDA